MPYWKTSAQIDVAAWRTHVRKSVEMLVPGEWEDRGDIESNLRHHRLRLLGAPDGKSAKFVVEVVRRITPETITRQVESPAPGYNTTYETHSYPKSMDSGIGHKGVSFSCDVAAYPGAVGFGRVQVASASELDTPYEVAEFVRSAITGYSEGDNPEDAPEPAPAPPAAEPKPSLIPA